MKSKACAGVFLTVLLILAGCTPPTPEWELANPIEPLPDPPLGVTHTFDELEVPPTPESVRLGKWLFYDTRLSADNTAACATCHRPENAFSEPTPVSTGIDGQKGGRKAPTFINAAWALLPHTFWDGRAGSLEDQALGPVANPIEMGNTHEQMIATLQAAEGYAKYFEEAFGTPEITNDRVAKATGDESELGAFKTPTVREVTKRAPYMHDGSIGTLREVVELYNRGGEPNPHLDPKIQPLDLTEEEVDALVAMMESLEGESYMDTPPTMFPQ